jgi:4-hydroxybenzoate polyprenyltransferase
LFFPAWTFLLAGYSRGEGSGQFLLLVWVGAALGASFLLNQIKDNVEDQLNSKLWPLWGSSISAKLIYAELAFLLAMVIIGGIWAGKELSGFLALYLVIAGVFYNFRPIRLKSRPILGVLACGSGAWIGYLIGARAAAIPFASSALSGLPYALAAMAVTLLTHVPDLEGDSSTGIKTFPVVYGLSLTGGCALALVLISAMASAALGDFLLLTVSLLSLPFFVRFYYKQSREAAQLSIKVSVFGLAVAVGTTWIPFLVMIALYYPFARWYHRARLGLDYPSFRTGPEGTKSYKMGERRLERIGTI